METLEARLDRVLRRHGRTRLNVELEDPMRGYLSWLVASEAQAVARRWCQRADQAPEAAAAEALGWHLAIRKGVEVRPGNDPPDFECQGKSGAFHLECTAILESTAERYTGLPHFEPGPKARNYRPLTDAIHEKLEQRVRSSFQPAHPWLVLMACFNAMAFATITDPMHVEFFLQRLEPKMARDSWARLSAVVVIGAATGGLPLRAFRLPGAMRAFPADGLAGVSFQDLGVADFSHASVDNPWICRW